MICLQNVSEPSLVEAGQSTLPGARIADVSIRKQFHWVCFANLYSLDASVILGADRAHTNFTSSAAEIRQCTEIRQCSGLLVLYASRQYADVTNPVSLHVLTALSG